MSDIPIFYEGEVWLLGWAESHNSGCKITLALSDPDELEKFRSVTLRKGRVAGQRFQIVLVELSEDEKPVPQSKHHASRDAHLMVTGENYIRYINETLGNDWKAGQVRLHAKHQMKVDSLSELDTDPAALRRFHELVRRPFEQWMENNHVDNDREPGQDDDLGERD